jgi:hypothetical protein
MERFPEEIYVLREGQFEGLYSIMMLNHSLKYYSYKEEYPWNLKIIVDLVDRNEQGLPTHTEADILNNFEDKIVELLSGVCQFHFIGRTTWNGERTLMFYLNEPEYAHDKLQDLIEEVEIIKKSSSQIVREFEYTLQEDPEWLFVKDYYNYDDNEIEES